MTWFRHRGPAEVFHTGEPVDDVRSLLCAGRWPLADERRGEVEQAESPPIADRCVLCWLRADNARLRAALEERELELLAALRELADAHEFIRLTSSRAVAS